MYWPAAASQRIVLPVSAELTDVTVSFTTLLPAPEYLSVIFGASLPLPQLRDQLDRDDATTCLEDARAVAVDRLTDREPAVGRRSLDRVLTPMLRRLTAAGSEIVNCSPASGLPLLFGSQNSHCCGSSAASKVYGTSPRPGKYSARLSPASIGSASPA